MYNFLHSGSARKVPGDPPMLPFIPPPPITPSPNHSRQNSIDSWSSSVSAGAKLGTSDLELSENKRNPPPQEFLRFVFDNSNTSDVFMATEDSSDSTVTADGAESAIAMTTNEKNTKNISSPVTKSSPNGV